MKIAAVILTYNRKDLLSRCLDAVAAQSRPCDDIIVIDNASTDGTEEMLRRLPLRNVTVHRLSENIGASGGFNAGFRLAYQSGADQIWMMDDDVIPAEDALQQLVNADKLLAGQNIEPAFLLSTAYTEQGLVTNAPSIDQRPNRIAYENWPLTLEYGVAPVRRATFVSILVPRRTLATYGLPIASMFIWGEDTEYTLRITEHAPGFVVGSSKVVHLRQENGAIDIMAERNPNRVKYHRHYVRNEVFVARKYYRPRRVVISVLHQCKVALKLLFRGDFHKAAIVFSGLVESGPFYPAIESVDAPMENLGVSVETYTAGSPAGWQPPDHLTLVDLCEQHFCRQTLGPASLI